MTIDSDSSRFSRALKAAILWPVGVIFFSAFLLVLMIFMLLEVVKWSEHSYEVLAAAQSCEQLVLNVQNEVRGYALAGDRTVPAVLAQEQAQTDIAFEKLKFLVRDNRDQVIRMQDLIAAKNLWFDHAKGAIDFVAHGTAIPADWVKMGTDMMDDIRAKFKAFDQVEEQLHRQRIHNVQRTKRAIGLAGGGLVLILAFTVGQLVRRQFVGLATEYRTALHTIEQRHAALTRSEADLEAQKEWFRVTLTSIGDAVIVTDPDGRVVFMNHECERLTGWHSVEALLKPLSTVFRIVNEETRQKVEDPVVRVFREKVVVGLANHTLLISREGREWPIEDSAAPIFDSKGAILGVVLVFHDASESRRSQNALKIHSEELEKRISERTVALQQTVSDLEAFSYTISHDLRSPLRAMQGFAQAVLEDYGDKLDEQGKNYLGRIKNAAERLDRLIQDLLSYTRISRQDAPVISLDADAILRDIIQYYPNLHPPAAEVEIDGKLPRIMGQEAALTQVLSNLLGNGAKFVPAGTVPHLRVWSEDLGKHVRIWIQDNGIGISPQDYERIFQMFVQVNEPNLYGGTGVGLAIVKKAVESMQGAVGLDSPQEGGSRFWVELLKASE
jgi:PAS domain S-box-containing protein